MLPAVVVPESMASLNHWSDCENDVVIAVTSLAIQLANGFIKLFQFWDSIRGAPEEISVIMDDPMLLSAVLRDISHGEEQAPAVTLALNYCRTKLFVRHLNPYSPILLTIL